MKKSILSLILLVQISLVEAKPRFNVLVFYGVGGTTRPGREAANQAILDLGRTNNFLVDTIRDAAYLIPLNLEKYQAIIMNNSSELGKILNAQQKIDLMEYLKSHGHVGIHLSAETMGSFPEYSEYMGTQSGSWGGSIATVNLDTASDYAKTNFIPQTLPTQTQLSENWYAFRPNPRLAKGIHVLYTLDEANCPNCAKMGPLPCSTLVDGVWWRCPTTGPEAPPPDHPIVWTRESETGGRMFYMAMGHNATSFSNDFSKTLLLRAIQWAAKDSGTTVAMHSITKIVTPKSWQIANEKGFIKVSISTPSSFKIEIIYLNGQQVFVKQGIGPQEIHFLQPPKPGLYIVKVNIDGQEFSKKLLLTK